MYEDIKEDFLLQIERCLEAEDVEMEMIVVIYKFTQYIGNVLPRIWLAEFEEAIDLQTIHLN